MSIQKCPKCGTASGYFTKRRVTMNTAYDFSHEPWDTEIEENGAGEKRKYCLDCKKDITRFVDEGQGAENA